MKLYLPNWEFLKLIFPYYKKKKWLSVSGNDKYATLQTFYLLCTMKSFLNFSINGFHVFIPILEVIPLASLNDFSSSVYEIPKTRVGNST